MIELSQELPVLAVPKIQTILPGSMVPGLAPSGRPLAGAPSADDGRPTMRFMASLITRESPWVVPRARPVALYANRGSDRENLAQTA